MTGNSTDIAAGTKRRGRRRMGAIVQPRDRRLLGELDIMRVIDREQAQAVSGFDSIRRANRRLLKLTRVGLLRRIFVPQPPLGQKALYTLSPHGAAISGARLPGLPFRQSFGQSPFLLHRLAINQIYVIVKYRPLPLATMSLARWTSFRKPLTEAVPLIPDGYFEIACGGAVHAMFLEVDLGTESLPVWRKKIQLYLELALSGCFPDLFRQGKFRVLVIATTEQRLRHIRKVTAAATEKIFWLSTFDQIKQRGFWSPVWLRPTGDRQQPLI